ncbi:hypothetical protein RZS08_12660, partial [Arthrospira platensis SPKY1]|nr:hypothetical protein [Arthrospira platensis SPKY1]
QIIASGLRKDQKFIRHLSTNRVHPLVIATSITNASPEKPGQRIHTACNQIPSQNVLSHDEKLNMDSGFANGFQGLAVNYL